MPKHHCSDSQPKRGIFATVFRSRLQAQGVLMDWKDFNGLHQVKDMDQVTDAGRAVRQYISQKSIELVGRTKAADGAMPRLTRQDAMVGLAGMNSQEIAGN
jgi:hypothetical protein